MIEKKVNFFPTNVYSDSNYGFFSLSLHSRLSQLEKYSIHFLLQTGEMLVDVLKHLEPCLPK